MSQTPNNDIPNDTTSARNRIILTDPNEIIAQQLGRDGQNAIPDYETMSPFVEIYAIRKEGVEIVLGENGNYETKGTNKASKINFLNFDIPSQSYTTNYTGDIVGTPDRDSNEGFGISSINVKMNANYMPMVEVKFIDIKGSSVIRPGDKSPLAALFDFPSPIFKMRLKGAFGKFVEYDLHMTGNDIQYTDGGDFIIDAKFIGEYFGPLTDVLLGYIKSVPYLKGQESAIENDDRSTYQLQSGETTTINSFFELVNRGELLYTKIAAYEAATTKTKQISDKKAALESIPDARKQIAALNNFDKGELLSYGKKLSPPQTDGLNTITSGLYNGKENTFALRVPVTYDPINANFASNPLTNLISGYIADVVYNNLSKAVTQLKESARDTNIDFESLVKKGADKTEPNYYTFYIDYFDLIQKLDYLENVVKNQIIVTAKSMQDDAKKIVKSSIDFRPSIRNIFEILLNDFDSFLTILKTAGETVKPLGSPQFLVSLVKPLVQAPFPEVVVKKKINTAGVGAAIESDVLVYPGTVPEFRDWEEVKLVESYCKSLVSQIKAEQQIENLNATSTSPNYIPLFPLESYLGPANELNIYRNVTSPSALFKYILTDYVTLRDYAYGVLMNVNDDVDYTLTGRQRFSTLTGARFIIDKDARTKLVRVLARSQARNIANGLAGTNKMSEKLLSITDNTLTAIRAMLDKTGMDKNVLSFYFEIAKVLPTINLNRVGLKDLVLHRSNLDFNGIKEVMDPNNTDIKQLITAKVTDGSDFDTERNEMIDLIASTIYGADTTYKPIVTMANTLLFNDNAAKSGSLDGPTDFLSNGTGYTAIARSVIYTSSNNPDKKLKAPDTAIKFIEGNSDLQQATNLLGNNDPIIAKKFLYPGAVEVPYWYAVYIGYLIRVDTSDTFGSAISKADRKIFGVIWDKFSANYNKDIVIAIQNENYDTTGKSDEAIKTEITGHLWFKNLISKRYIINNSSTTFLEPDHLKANGEVYRGFRSVQLSETDATLIEYLNTLIGEIQKKLKEYAKKNEGAITQAENKFSDPDFKLNVYMSFKAIYDRWLAGNNDYIGIGGQKAANPLRERFKFITRSQQDIGDLNIVDFRNFSEDAKNPEMNVFSTISRLLGANQYMFFPLHSFMEYNKGNVIENWENNFKILSKYTETNLSKPSFVCMYIGSYSSRLNTGSASANYAPDGFSLKESVGMPSDFSGDQGGNVFAFNVKVGSQSQMIFSSFTANTTEFKNTDVSLKIQDDIINKQTETNRIGKAQNLLNIYNQRSYTMGVTIPFGNMCIQPTQYFEITGIPIWNGVYMIHEVTHNIAAGVNRLVTQFKGYKLGKYSFPVVTDYLMSFLGISNEFGSDVMNIASSVDVSLLDAETINEINKLDPTFAPIFLEFLASVAADGWKVSITDGRRSYENQIRANKANKKNPYPGGKYDSHIQGFAIDCNFDKGNIYLRSTALKSTKEQWEASGIPQKAISLGLRWGGNFSKYLDLVHFDVGFPDGKTLGPRTAIANIPIAQANPTQKYNSANDKGLFLSSLLPFGNNNDKFSQAVRTLAAKLFISPNSLMATMYLESEFKTSARSRTSSAAGLIQFVNSTAMDYTGFYNTSIRPQAKLPHNGLTSRFVATLDEFDQLKLVGEFLHRNLRGVSNRKNEFFDISFSIFHPASQQKPDSHIMFNSHTKAYAQNRDFDKQNKGYVTIKDYKDHILSRIHSELGVTSETFLNITA